MLCCFAASEIREGKGSDVSGCSIRLDPPSTVNRNITQSKGSTLDSNGVNYTGISEEACSRYDLEAGRLTSASALSVHVPLAGEFEQVS